MIEDQLTIAGIVAILLTAIGHLWKEQRADRKKSDDRSEKCQEQHKETQSELLAVTKEVGELKGRVQIAEQIVPVLNEIREEVRANK